MLIQILSGQSFQMTRANSWKTPEPIHTNLKAFNNSVLASPTSNPSKDMEIEVKNEGKYEDNLITSNDIDLEKENHEAVKDKFENQDTIPVFENYNTSLNALEKIFEEIETSKELNKQEENEQEVLSECLNIIHKEIPDSLQNYLRQVRNSNLDDQPSNSVLKRRSEDNRNLPLSLICEKGRPKDGVRRKYYVNLNPLYEAGIIKNDHTDIDYKKYGKLHFSVISDFSNDQPLNGYKMLTVSKGDVVLVCGAYLCKIVIGFIITPSIANCTQKGLVECGLIPTKYLDKFCISDFPLSNRQYQYKNWSISEDTKHLDVNGDVAPIAIAIAKFDFNYTNKLPFLDLEKYPETKEISNEKYSKVPFLSIKIDDIILVTSMPNNLGWFEGYKATDNSCTLGLCHNDFVLFVEF